MCNQYGNKVSYREYVDTLKALGIKLVSPPAHFLRQTLSLVTQSGRRICRMVGYGKRSDAYYEGRRESDLGDLEGQSAHNEPLF